MNPVESVKTVLSKYAVTQGRASLSEYWWFFLFTLVVTLACTGIDLLLPFPIFREVTGGVIAGPFTAAATLFLLVPSVTVAMRRLHDADYSGGLVLLAAVPVIGPLILIAPLLVGPTQGRNRFGPWPAR